MTLAPGRFLSPGARVHAAAAESHAPERIAAVVISERPREIPAKPAHAESRRGESGSRRTPDRNQRAAFHPAGHTRRAAVFGRFDSRAIIGQGVIYRVAIEGQPGCAKSVRAAGERAAASREFAAAHPQSGQSAAGHHRRGARSGVRSISCSWRGPRAFTPYLALDKSGEQQGS